MHTIERYIKVKKTEKIRSKFPLIPSETNLTIDHKVQWSLWHFTTYIGKHYKTIINSINYTNVK